MSPKLKTKIDASLFEEGSYVTESGVVSGRVTGIEISSGGNMADILGTIGNNNFEINATGASGSTISGHLNADVAGIRVQENSLSSRAQPQVAGLNTNHATFHAVANITTIGHQTVILRNNEINATLPPVDHRLNYEVDPYISRLFRELSNVIDLNYVHCGKMVQWQETEEDVVTRIINGVLRNWNKFGIVLSEKFVFYTGYRSSIIPFNSEMKIVENDGLNPNDHYCEQEIIIERLLYAIVCFIHYNYRPNLGWNSEHFSRLVATCNPVSYQTSNHLVISAAGFFNFSIANIATYRLEARSTLQQFIGAYRINDLQNVLDIITRNRLENRMNMLKRR